MYVFQFMDATWRISRYTNTKFPLPIKGAARVMFDAVYTTEQAAYIGLQAVKALATTNPEMFV